jgi:hypothetical protein
MRPGFAVEDGVALHFRRTRLKRVVSSRLEASAYMVEPGGDGVVETRLEASYLGAGQALCESDPPARTRDVRRPASPEPVAA